MASDGKVIIDTDLDSAGFVKGLENLGGLASKGLKATASAITAVGSGLAMMSAAAVKTGMEFEAQMSRVSAISGATGADLEKLEQQAIDLGASTAFSATEAAQGMENLASAGFSVNEITAAMPGMLDLAASSGEDLATSADIAASTLRGFGLEASEASHVADVLAKNAADTNAAVLDTGDAMKYVAPVAHAMGMSLEEVTASIGLMANAGIQGSQAGTTLRSALSRLVNPTQTMQDTMDELGVSFFDSQGKMLSMVEIVGVLQEATAGLTDEEKNQALSVLFGQEALSGMLALIEAGPEELAELTASLEDCDGAAAAMADTMMDNLKGSIESLKGSLETLGILVYKDFQEPLKNAATAGEDYVHQLIDAFEGGGLEGLVSELGTVFADLTNNIVQSAPAAANAAVSLIQSFLSGIESNLPSIATSAVELGTTLLQGVLTIIPQALSVGMEFVTNMATGITQSAPTIVGTVSQFATDMLATFAEQGPQMITAGVTMIQSLGEGIASALPELIPLAIETILSLASGFVENIGTIVDVGISIVTALVEGIVNSIPILIEQVPALINSFWAAFDENAFKLIEAGLNLIVQLGLGIIQNIPLIIENAGQIVSAIFNNERNVLNNSQS